MAKETTYEEMGWVCIICGEEHPINHECLFNPETGEHCCCRCEGRLRVKLEQERINQERLDASL